MGETDTGVSCLGLRGCPSNPTPPDPKQGQLTSIPSTEIPVTDPVGTTPTGVFQTLLGGGSSNTGSNIIGSVAAYNGGSYPIMGNGAPLQNTPVIEDKSNPVIYYVLVGVGLIAIYYVMRNRRI